MEKVMEEVMEEVMERQKFFEVKIEKL